MVSGTPGVAPHFSSLRKVVGADGDVASMGLCFSHSAALHCFLPSFPIRATWRVRGPTSLYCVIRMVCCDVRGTAHYTSTCLEEDIFHNRAAGHSGSLYVGVPFVAAA